MSYQSAAALQTAIYGALTAAPALAGVAVVDAMPPGTAPGSFVLIGPEVVVDQSDISGAGAEHRFQLSVISDAPGFMPAKAMAGAVSDAVLGGGMVLGAGHLVGVQFLRATARRIGQGQTRRIDLTFRARIEI